MKLDRKLQYDILTELMTHYPDSVLVESLAGYSYDTNFMGNLFYLKEHGLIDGDDIRVVGHCRSMVDVQITAKGIDLMNDDGGTKAILGDISISIPLNMIIDSFQKNPSFTVLPEGKQKDLTSKLIQFDKQQLKDILQHGLYNLDMDSLSSLVNSKADPAT